MEFKTIGFVAARHSEAQEALVRMESLYDHVRPEDADIVVALGGDGFMLRSLHANMERRAPVYGMNRGSVGFLMNQFEEGGLMDRLQLAEVVELHPLQMEARDIHGEVHHALAINEVSLLRETRMAAKLRIKVDGIERMSELICDGALVSTPAGSTAYNASAHGPIVPIGAELLALTPISAYRPRRWHGALLPHHAEITFDVLDAHNRTVSAVADYQDVAQVESVTISQNSDKYATLLFDPEHALNERIIKEQFLP
ncbi:MAG: NAD kinase [Rhodospirillales bacterium]|nr:NAD kinase [Rhodospirillales bacterium]MBT4628063.1 NAD kinase [Rhodospirillales bacterium]MBT5353228.1 NAD kinase [Rhodospirillales bacterium]MBT5522431.1 NAD kinase [Rhodospirillales bacterium]MBT6108926.1 NAD kinase [Rhodospirillales bacterium]